MNAVVEVVEARLPAPVARRGISEAQWRTAMNNLFPGARAESVLMVFDYCAARKLDPLKKPCHIVPMKVRSGDDYVWRDVVMPGIYEYRTTAARTGEYLGHSIPEYGEIVEHLGRTVPVSCSITVYRWNKAAAQRAEYPVTLWFEECCATKRNKKTSDIELNERWEKAPRQMLTKCVEAAALREAFPDELGGTHTADEMEGQPMAAEPPTPQAQVGYTDPRGDLSDVDWELVNTHVRGIAAIVNEVGKDDPTKDEYWGAVQMRAYVQEHLQPDPELYFAVNDKLAQEKVLTKKQFKDYLSLVLEGVED